jgi:hypothetical protein
LTASLRVAVLEPAVVAWLVLEAVDDGVVASPTVAVGLIGRGELPPQPATRTALISVALASRHARRERVIRFESLPAAISSPSAVSQSVDRVLRDRRFPPGFAYLTSRCRTPAADSGCGLPHQRR